ncbi:hypothetical protein [Microbulbifer salipaludis]|nr:hypothetical protein [Microbulbifer salipaludis]
MTGLTGTCGVTGALSVPVIDAIRHVGVDTRVTGAKLQPYYLAP